MSVVEEESSGESSPVNAQRMRGSSCAITEGSTDMRSTEVSDEGEKTAPWQRELKKKRDHLPPEVVPQAPATPAATVTPRLNSMKLTSPKQLPDATEQAQASPYTKSGEPKESVTPASKSTHRFAGNKGTSTLPLAHLKQNRCLRWSMTIPM
jgi:hypothetical protein